MPTAKMLAAELLKVRKRWMPYLLLLPVVAVLAFQTFVAYFSGWRQEHSVQALGMSVLPSSFGSLLDLIQFFSALVIGILAASIAGTEFGWGTARQALARGQTRVQYLTTKLLAITLLGAVGFLLFVGFAMLFTVITTTLEDAPLTFGEERSNVDAALMVVRTAYTIVPYVLLAFALAIVGRSTTLGVVGVVLFLSLEAIVHAVLTVIGGGAADARAYFMVHNVMAVLALNQAGPVDYFSITPRGSPIALELPDAGVAALVLALYSGVFLTIAYAVFLRRDVHA